MNKNFTEKVYDLFIVGKITKAKYDELLNLYNSGEIKRAEDKLRILKLNLNNKVKKIKYKWK